MDEFAALGTSEVIKVENLNLELVLVESQQAGILRRAISGPVRDDLHRRAHTRSDAISPAQAAIPENLRMPLGSTERAENAFSLRTAPSVSAPCQFSGLY